MLIILTNKCLYKFQVYLTFLISFRLGEIVRAAGGDFQKMAIKGGVMGIGITWNCDLDWDFNKYCLPEYKFRILDTYGWNFRHALYHEENRRTLVKAYGLKFLVVVDGRSGH